MAAFQADTISVYRVGDGVAALASVGTAVFVDEYSSSGTLLQSIALPTTVNGAQRQLVASGSSTSEGNLNRSTDSNYLVFTGYDAALLTSPLSSTTSVTVNRVVGRIDGSGTIDTSTALTDAASGNNPRSVASTNGTDLWVAGGAGGLRYTTFGSTTSTQINAAPGTNPLNNVRTTSIQAGQLYLSTGSGSAVRIASVGTGVPTTAGQNTTPLPGLPTSTGSPYGFFLADLDAGVAGVDTLYVADDAATPSGGILKYSLVAGTWTANGSVPGTNSTIAGNRGLTGTVSGSTVTLIGTSATRLFTVVDAAGYNATISPTVTSLATAGLNQAFRGVALSPVSATTQVSVAATDATKNEGNTGTGPSTSFTFTLTRSGPVTGTSSASYAITGTGGNPANATDFVGGVLPTGTVNFLANETSKLITIDVVGDLTAETNEGFTLTLSNPVGTSIGTATAVGSIVNDDASATFAIAATDAVKAEGNSGTTAFTFTVTRTGTSGTNTVDFAITGFGGNAANAADFDLGVFPSGTLTFTPGVPTQVITVLVAGDTLIEPDEDFRVTLSNGSIGTAISVPTADGSILTDDSLVTITTANLALAEGNSGPTTYSYTLTRTGNVSGASDVSWSVAGSGVSPASADDFVGNAFPTGIVSFLATEITKTVTFDVQGDLVIEPTETFTLSLISATNNTSVGIGTGSGTITNDDFQVLAPGDIVITGINGDTPDQFSFVPLIDLVPGAQISFTDNGWTGTALTTNEGTIQYTAPAGGLLAGTKIVIEYTSITVLSVFSGTGSVTASGSFGLSTSGDSLLAYTGLSASPSFVYAVTTFGDAYRSTGSVSTNDTYLPPTLVVGTSAVDALGPTATTDVDNGQYNHTLGTTGSPSAIRTLVGNRLNWTTSDTTLTPLDLANFTVTGSPASPTIIVTAPNAVYTSVAYASTGSTVTGAGIPAPVVTFTYYIGTGTGGTNLGAAAPINVGTYTVVGSSEANAGNTAATGAAVTFQITKATPSITSAPTASAITSGQSLASSNLTGGSASGVSGVLPGSFTFTTPTTVPAVGTASQATTFTPGDASNYNTVSGTTSVTVNAAAVAPTFTGATVNGGDTFLNAVQRSQVTSLVLAFSAPVVIAPNAFTVANVGLLTAQSAAALASSQIIVTGSGTSTITLTWTGGVANGSNGVVSRSGTGSRSSSLADGNWQLSIDSSKVTAVSGSLPMTGNSTDKFFRMYGDSNGDGRVDGVDIFNIRRSLAVAAPYNAAFDWDGNGSVSAGQDTIRFSSNQNRRRRLF